MLLMRKRNKGNRLNEFVEDHVVFDLETTGVNLYRTKIIEIAAIKVRSGNVVDEFVTLVNPEAPIPKEATLINHITDEMVIGAPRLNDVLDSFRRFIGDDVLVGHNILTFDSNLLYDAFYLYDGFELRNDIIDTLYISRKCLRELTNHKLQTICEHYGFDTDGAHRALTDCYLTEMCFCKLKDLNAEYHYLKPQGFTRPIYSDNTKLLQELQSLLKKFISNCYLTKSDVMELNDWMDLHPSLSGNYPFDEVFIALNVVLEDGYISSHEMLELSNLFKQIIDPVDEKPKLTKLDLRDKICCLTGEFNYGDKCCVEGVITMNGGVCRKNVTSKTDYVIVGGIGSNHWTNGTYGAKIKKALELQSNGSGIQIIKEKYFFDLLDSHN